MSITLNLGRFHCNIGSQTLIEIAAGAYFGYNVYQVIKNYLPSFSSTGMNYESKIVLSSCMIFPTCAIFSNSVIANTLSAIARLFFSSSHSRNTSPLEWGRLRLTIGLIGFLGACASAVANERMTEDKEARNYVRRILIPTAIFNPISLYCISRAVQMVFGKYLN